MNTLAELNAEACPLNAEACPLNVDMHMCTCNHVITIRKTQTVEINLDAEFERLKDEKEYSKAQAERLREIYWLFGQGRLGDCLTAYNNLPYDDVYGCTEKEYVAADVHKVLQDFNWKTCDMEIIREIS